MAENNTFPTTTDELEEYISSYLLAHLSDAINQVTTAAIAQAVRSYMQEYGAALEDNAVDGEVPLIADGDLNANSMTIPLTEYSGGVPVRFIQARIRALALAAAETITSSDLSLPIVTQSDDDVTIAPNCLNVWDEPLLNLRIGFAAGSASKLNEYMIQFTAAGSTMTLEFDDDVTWMEEPEFEAGYTYQVSVVNGMAIYGEWRIEEES